MVVPLAGQPPSVPAESVFNVTTEVVVVDAQVTDRRTGRVIDSLRRDDFQLCEDDVPQAITYFSRDQLPLSIILLFDLTDTTRPVLKPLARGAAAALEHLRADDEVAVMVYSATASLIQDFTTDRKSTIAAIERASNMKSREAAFFNEAVWQASAQSRKAANPRSRRVIVWLTDNMPTLPSPFMKKTLGKSLGDREPHTESEAFRDLFESGTVVCSLVESSAAMKLVNLLPSAAAAAARKDYPPGDVYKYAGETGGEVMKPRKAEIAAGLATLLDHLRARYSLGYRPSAPGPATTFRRIRLTLTPQAAQGNDFVVRTRTGYYRTGP